MITYLMCVLLCGVVVGLIAVASNPAPYYAALGLVLASGVGCGVLAGHGGTFLCLVLFLIYLGGMLVVFAYSAALAAEPFPETWGDKSVMSLVVVYSSGVLAGGVWSWETWYGGSWVMGDEFKELSVVRGDSGGAARMYSEGAPMLVLCAWVLLVTLLVVLELTRGMNRGVLRAV
uniref:NADH-ubiquinone oxidoreductase chain 6 n=1 Tax=Gonorynchus greyi TaxID=149986 RepID=Q85DW0_9TELE|nr:NADH dehydrogenase subunit 6 [Gonorynchus greyi]BAC67531.1 NADH dehydrogenase subunit 6 [Gonorynchus greyi]